MALPKLSPISTTSKSILPSTGSGDDVTATNLPFGVYTSDMDFVTGAVAQVSYTYRKLGGDVLDIEVTAQNVYAAYEESVLEYSYMVNMYQSKNVLSDLLGETTGTFDYKGEFSGSNNTLPNVALKYPRFNFGYARRLADTFSEEVAVGGSQTVYSASISLTDDVQDYDLQKVIQASSSAGGVAFANKVQNNKVLIRRVFYKSPSAMWRFYGYYGGIGTIGNLTTYGQYADDSTWQFVPVWQNKAQSAAFEDAMKTRTSHYSYEIRNNKIRIFPIPNQYMKKIWVEFTVKENSWEEVSDRKIGIDGINNINSLPFANIPYTKINSIGKQWIRKYALSLTKEMLGQVRGKFTTVPIPGESVTLNATELLSQAKEEQTQLKEELKNILMETSYEKLAESDGNMSDNASKLFQGIPRIIFMG